MTAVIRESELNKVLGAIYSAKDLDEFRRAVLEGLMSVVPFESGAFFLTDKTDFLEPYSINLDEGMFAEYKDYYEVLDQYKTTVFSQPFIPAVDRSSDYLDYNQWQKNEHRADFLLRRGIHNLACIQVFAGDKLAGMLSLHRNKRQEDFSDEEMQTLLTLSSHINRAYAKAASFGRIEEKADLFEEIFNLLDVPIILLNNRLELIYFNSAARTGILSGIRVKTGDLMIHLRSVCAKMFKMDRLPGTWSLTTRFPTPAGHRSFHIYMRAASGNNGPQFIIYSPNDTVETMSWPGNLGWELSYKEREVARMLVCGKSNEEIAGIFSISLNTVKTHVSSILRKSGARNRAEFIAKFLIG